MAKNIVFCADGTWNHPGEKNRDIVADTNVYKFYKALEAVAGQVSGYDDGVGADGTPIDRLLGGAIGEGLFGKIKDGYRFVAQHYDPGDQIYIFGFSRGAYTARSLAGMIAICGLPDQSKFSDAAINEAFSAYRMRTNQDPVLQNLQRKYGNNNSNIEIAMVGVWDTVGALGIPGEIFDGLDEGFYGFLDTNLHPDVKAAYHAVSIDERRPEFVPTLWNPDSVAPGNKFEQIWFAGVHADVGGGYADCGLANITLRWMLENARRRGVLFDANEYATHTNVGPKHALDLAHESWHPLWGFPERRHVRKDADIANSVEIRITHETRYQPVNLDIVPPGNLADTYNIRPIL